MTQTNVNSDSLHAASAGARLLVLDELQHDQVIDAKAARKQPGSPPPLCRTLYAPVAGRCAYSSSIEDNGTAPMTTKPSFDTGFPAPLSTNSTLTLPPLSRPRRLSVNDQ